MRKCRVSYNKLLRSMLTREERYQLWEIVNNGWMRVRVSFFNCDDATALAFRELSKKRLIRVSESQSRLHGEAAVTLEPMREGIRLCHELEKIGLA